MKSGDEIVRQMRSCVDGEEVEKERDREGKIFSCKSSPKGGGLKDMGSGRDAAILARWHPARSLGTFLMDGDDNCTIAARSGCDKLPWLRLANLRCALPKYRGEQSKHCQAVHHPAETAYDKAASVQLIATPVDGFLPIVASTAGPSIANRRGRRTRSRRTR
jgi:hypothetical protein